MKLKLIVTALVVAAMPMYAQAQSPNPPKPSKPAKAAPAVPAAPVSKVAAAQKVVKTISGDKIKTETYCDIGKLGEQIEEAEKKNDMKKIDELNKKMDDLATKLGPEYVALMGQLEDVDFFLSIKSMSYKKMDDLATKLGPEYVALMVSSRTSTRVRKRVRILVRRSGGSTSCARSSGMARGPLVRQIQSRVAAFRDT